MALFLVRGLPGSGKSTYAKLLGCLHVEADMYFMTDGVYKYNRNDIRNAHAWCQEITYASLCQGVDVVVSNTFTRLKEMEYYIGIAEQFKTPVHVIRCMGQFNNVHNVPQETLDAMRNRFEVYPGEVITNA